jgi:L,D-transpeptidase YcbB
MKRRTLSAALVALVNLAGCGEARTEQSEPGQVSRSWNPAEVDEIRGVPIADVRAALTTQLKTRPAHATGEQWEHLRRLYRQFGTAPLWLDEEGLISDRMDALVDALVNATTDGIRIEQYPLAQLAIVLDSMMHVRRGTAAQYARVDLLMTSAYIALAEDYLTGQVDPKTVSQSWHIDPEEQQVDSAMARSLREDALARAMERMRPQDADYEVLRRALADFRKVVSAGGWTPVPAGKALKRGDRDAPTRLAALRKRLQAEGIATGDSTQAGVVDQALAAGIATFQARHGIAVDSMLGGETLDALNVPATFRLAQIAANLERYRWLPRNLGARYIFVNVPAFKLNGYEDGKSTIEMKVIVGAEYDGRSTPVFSDRMEYVVFRPYWNVTDAIAQNELLPQFAAGGMPADYETYSENGVTRLRQRPGPKNSLGLVKFMFPNDFNIYLHDTPNDALFKKDVRAFSHGCIRLEKPEELAQWVLGWSPDKVRAAMHGGGDNRTVQLPRKIPVYIAYMTTYVRDGTLWFANDLYNRDAALARAVAGGAMPSADAVRAIEALRRITG